MYNYFVFRFLNVYFLVRKASFVHSLFLVYLSISTCFGRLCAHRHEKRPCLCDTWCLLFFVDDCLVCGSICSHIPDSHSQRMTSTKCRLNTVVSPDDGHIVARNMQRLTNILRINCAPSWLYLQDYTGMHGQRNLKKYISLFKFLNFEPLDIFYRGAVIKYLPL